MELITEIIIQQNYELLVRISKQKYNDEKDREKFIDKYYKKNYCRLISKRKNKVGEYQKNIIRLI